MIYKTKSALIFIMGIFLLGTHYNTSAQETKTQLVKKWNYKGIEEFGVVRPPDTLSQNDFLEMKADGNFIMKKEGKQLSGTWLLNDKSAVLSLVDTRSKKKFNFTIKNLNDRNLELEYQTPDLVRTNYHYQLEE